MAAEHFSIVWLPSNGGRIIELLFAFCSIFIRYHLFACLDCFATWAEAPRFELCFYVYAEICRNCVNINKIRLVSTRTTPTNKQPKCGRQQIKSLPLSLPPTSFPKPISCVVGCFRFRAHFRPTSFGCVWVGVCMWQLFKCLEIVAILIRPNWIKFSVGTKA